ncbi:MAG: hypothetical protein ACHQUC_04350 [Chlamydiales bacterium]
MMDINGRKWTVHFSPFQSIFVNNSHVQRDHLRDHLTPNPIFLLEINAQIP